MRLLPVLLASVAALPSAAEPLFDPASTVFLTWSDDPTSTIEVQWLDGGTARPDAPETAGPGAASVPIAPAAPDAGGGTRLTHLRSPDPEPGAAGGFGATARVGWSADALTVVADVVDDTPHEGPDGQLWSGDGVEVMLYHRDPPEAPEAPNTPGFQVIATPGLDPRFPGVRTAYLPRGGDPSDEEVAAAEAAVRATATPTDAGYRLELSVPWPAVGPAGPAGPGDRFGLQVVVNDRDGDAPRSQRLLFPAEDAFENPASTADVVLVDDGAPAPPLRATVTVETADGDSAALEVTGDAGLVGESVTLRSGGLRLGEVALVERAGVAHARLPLLEPPAFAAGTVELGGAVVGRFAVPDALRRVPGGTRRVTVGVGDATQSQQSETFPFEADRPSGVRIHRARFTGLEPGTSHDLTIEGVGGPWAFETAPATLDRPLVFAEGGDVGTGRYVRPLHEEAAAWDPLFGVVGGDLAYADGLNVPKWVVYLQDWHAYMREPGGGRSTDGEPIDRLIPMIVCIGNHEVQGGFGDDRAKAPLFNALFASLFRGEDNHALLDFGGYLSFLLLDSGHTTDPGGAQTDWLVRSLEERTHVPHLFAVYHVPMYPSHRPVEGGSRGPARAAMRANWLEPFADFHVPVAFEHDDHTYKRSVPMSRGERVATGSAGSTVYVGDGAWGKGDRAADRRDYLYASEPRRNVIRVEVRPDGTRSFLAVDPDGAVLDVFDVNTPRPGAAGSGGAGGAGG